MVTLAFPLTGSVDCSVACLDVVIVATLLGQNVVALCMMSRKLFLVFFWVHIGIFSLTCDGVVFQMWWLLACSRNKYDVHDTQTIIVQKNLGRAM